MSAAPQHAGVRPARPVLLRQETDFGHGARSVSRSVDLAADTLAITAAFTGLYRDPQGGREWEDEPGRAAVHRNG